MPATARRDKWDGFPFAAGVRKPRLRVMLLLDFPRHYCPVWGA